MNKIFKTVRHWISRLLEADAIEDYVDGLSIRDYADLPVTHPASDIR